MAIFIAALVDLGSKKQVQFNYPGLWASHNPCDITERIFFILSYVRFRFLTLDNVQKIKIFKYIMRLEAFVIL